MDLTDVKSRLKAVERELADHDTAVFADFDTPHGPLRVVIAARFRRRCRKGHVWNANAMFTALKNATYGFDPGAPRSRGGADGVFRVDRDFRPVNSMMKKLFGQFLDKPDPLVPSIEAQFGQSSAKWVPVRVVSHHMRLLGVLVGGDHLVLVDYDDEKGA